MRLEWSTVHLNVTMGCYSLSASKNNPRQECARSQELYFRLITTSKNNFT